MSIHPLNWTNGDGKRNRKVDAIVTELVRQASEGGFRKYTRSSVETAIRSMADVGSDDTVDEYVMQCCDTEALRAVAGEYYVTDTGFEQFEYVYQEGRHE